jgi:hypothetical protein
MYLVRQTQIATPVIQTTTIVLHSEPLQSTPLLTNCLFKADIDKINKL